MFKYLIIIFIILLYIGAYVLGPHTVVSPSMEDTFLVGDRLLVLNYWYGLRHPFSAKKIIRGHEPARNEFLLFTYPIDPSERHLKRCIAVGGDTLEIVAKKVFINGEEVPLPPGAKNADPNIIPMAEAGSGKRDFRPRMVLPDTTIYVMGDHRDFSLDSRIWGFLPKVNLRGRVGLILWSIDPEVPWTAIGKKFRWERTFKKPENLVRPE